MEKRTGKGRSLLFHTTPFSEDTSIQQGSNNGSPLFHTVPFPARFTKHLASASKFPLFHIAHFPYPARQKRRQETCILPFQASGLSPPGQAKTRAAKAAGHQYRCAIARKTRRKQETQNKRGQAHRHTPHHKRKATAQRKEHCCIKKKVLLHEERSIAA